MPVIEFHALIDQLSMPAVIAIYGSASLVAAVLAPLLAYRKRRHMGNWTVACFLFPPLLLVLLVLRRLSLEEYMRSLEREQAKRMIPTDLL